MPKRIKTNYPGVFYREAERIGGRGKEKIYYVVYKKNGKLYEEKAGRQFADDMTPTRASHYRSELIEGKKFPRKDQKIREEEQRKIEAEKYTIDRLWGAYRVRWTRCQGQKISNLRCTLHRVDQSCSVLR